MAWILANWGLIATILLGISEALALIPGLDSKGIIAGLINFLKGLGVKDPQGK